MIKTCNHSPLLSPRNTCAWKVGGTKTFRNASAMLFDRVGTNLQNPTNEICKLYIPDEGKVFVQCDLAGAEALIVAYLCRDGNFRSLFNYNIKPHTYVALHVFTNVWKKHLPEYDIHNLLPLSIPSLANHPHYKAVEKVIKSSDGWRASERYYFIAKMICHASNYGMKAPTFVMNVLEKSEGKIVLTRKQAEVYLETYHSLFPEIREWHSEVDEELKTKKCIRNLFGYPRMFYGSTKSDATRREAYAQCPQSTVGCITNKALVKLQDYIEDICCTEWDILNNKHDSILMQVPLAESQNAVRVLSIIMCQDLTSPRGEYFKMKAEASVGKNWGKYNVVNNPDGMREITI